MRWSDPLGYVWHGVNRQLRGSLVLLHLGLGADLLAALCILGELALSLLIHLRQHLDLTVRIERGSGNVSEHGDILGMSCIARDCGAALLGLLGGGVDKRGCRCLIFRHLLFWMSATSRTLLRLRIQLLIMYLERTDVKFVLCLQKMTSNV